MAAHNELGKRGEERAAAYLSQQGYTILERNWRLRHLELDIICRKDDLLVIVEVKTRREAEERPADLLSWKKRKNLLKAANAYVKKHRLELELRFDLIVVEGREGGLEHIEEAVSILDER